MADVPPGSGEKSSLRATVRWVLCRIGVHDYRVISITGSFGAGGTVEKRECRRCQKLTVRSGS
ncbi:uncharacterized protein METZ01_LOCUS189155 [marine metagenome]|uniref:Uncharacterized protein n=1 Tax=marine metagenome TaxID=408172 RepID=A0A382DF57_9ZZZZ